MYKRQEGIKRNLRDLPRQSYAECEDDCDEFDQSKKPKHGLNFLLAALNQDVIQPLRKIELQPISEQGLGSCVGEQRPPRREIKPPISELAVSDGTVPNSTGLSAIQVRIERSNGRMNSRNRLYSVNRYNTGQINESATKRKVDGIHGGEKTSGESCNTQSTRNKQRKNYYKPGYLMKAMLFVLFLVGCTGGTETVKNWKGTSLKAEGFDCGVPMNLQSYSILERCFVPALKPVEKIVLPSKPDFAKKVKFLQICNFFCRF